MSLPRQSSTFVDVISGALLGKVSRLQLVPLDPIMITQNSGSKLIFAANAANATVTSGIALFFANCSSSLRNIYRHVHPLAERQRVGLVTFLQFTFDKVFVKPGKMFAVPICFCA